VWDAVEDEGFAKLEPMGEVVSDFLMGSHDIL
jgi:hypothetical protein